MRPCGGGTVRSPLWLTLRTVHRSPFLTQSVAASRSRLLVRVITCVRGFRRRHGGLEQNAPVDGQLAPVNRLHFVGDATWVCRSGSPARLSRWANACNHPLNVNLSDPVGSVRV